jgi:hypothetical protein
MMPKVGPRVRIHFAPAGSHTKYAARTAESPEEVAALFGIAVEACAVEADPAKHRTLVGTTAAQFGFAVEDPSKLVYLPVLFDMLGARDEKLIPALARANATAQTRLLPA